LSNPKNPTRSFGEETVARRWFVADADDQVLGRFASRIATVLRGKHKPTYTPHVDGGDFVVVVNARAVRLTGRKLPRRSTSGTRATRAGCAATPRRRCSTCIPTASCARP
jgi:large subunit ribosomal protein L13